MPIALPAVFSATAPSAIQSASLKGWFRATDLALSDGDAVGTWLDQSGNSFDRSQGTAGAKPTYHTNIFGSRPAVQFATDDFMAADGAASAFGGSDQPYTYIACVKFNTISATAVFWSVASSSVANVFSYASHLTTKAIRASRRGGSGDTQLTLTTSETVIGETARIVVFRHNGTTHDIFFDNKKSVNGGAFDTLTLGTLDRCTIGCLRTSAGNNSFSNCYMAEDAYWNVALTDDEVLQVTNYLNQRWFA